MKMFKHINQYLSEYFGMSRTEARGFLLVILFTFLCITTPSVLKNYLSKEPITFVKEETDFFESEQEKTQYIPNFTEKKSQNREELIIEKFNPNHVKIEDWEKLGLPSHIAKRIIKYLAKGGKFRKKEDVQKIYGFPEKTYIQLSPYFVFTTLEPNKIPSQNYAKINQLLININTADSNELTKLNGIGVKLARRIILYRNSLGGFYDKKQIKEIYGLDSITYLKILPQLNVDKNFQTKKLSISQTENSIWFKHPYFRKIAKEIIQQKKLKPNFNKTEFLEYFSKSESDREKWNAYLMD